MQLCSIHDKGNRCMSKKMGHICDLLSQNEHKVATAAIQNYYRFKFLKMQALK